MQERILSYHENDIALALGLLTREERNKLYKILPLDRIAGVLEYAESPTEYIKELPIRKKVDVISRMDTAAAVDVLRQTSKEDRENLIDLIPLEARTEIKLLSSFDDDEIGSKMSTNYIEIYEGLSVKEAMSSLIAQAAENDNITTI